MSSIDATPERLFQCRRCGDCCKGFGGTYVDAEEIAAIGAFIGVGPADVVRIYCRDSGGRKLLAQGPEGYCIFWDRLCTIHPVKPRMCRRWPFIESVLIAPENWRIMAGSCPGIRTDAPMSDVCRCVEAQLASEDRGDLR